MKKSLPILIPIAALIIGLIGGAVASAHFYERLMVKFMKMSESVNLGQRCHVLIDLRAGKTNEAAKTLETLMDGDIIGFGSFLRDSPPDERTTEDMKLLTRVRDYRQAHPWKSSGYPDIDKGVAEVFVLLNTNSAR